LVSLPGDVDRMRRLTKETAARLLVVDPLSASLNGEIDSHRDQGIRRVLAALVQLAEELDLALIALAHWNKGQGGDALSRVLGSRGLTCCPFGARLRDRPGWGGGIKRARARPRRLQRRARVAVAGVSDRRAHR
jgi:hypothetical protein